LMDPDPTLRTSTSTSTSPSTSASSTGADGWREKLRAGTTSWGEMAATLGCAQGITKLHEWCTFITPDPEAARLKKGGFFTQFYTAICPASAVPAASARCSCFYTGLCSTPCY
jgi:hypothetical protein